MNRPRSTPRPRPGGRLCVYALTADRAARIAVRGLSREPLRVIREGSVAAIVGTLPRAPRVTRDSLRGYDAVMRALAARFATLLPARFGTTFDDPVELVFVLRSRQASLRRALAQVRNRVQMTVRMVEASGAGEAGEAPGPGSKTPPPLLPAPPAFRGTVYLAGRAAAAAREREVAGFEPIRAAVRRWIRDERVEKRAGVASIYHLVPRASADAYRAALERAAVASARRVVVTGPWPPYAFAEPW